LLFILQHESLFPVSFIFALMKPSHSSSIFFPYTTLFRSVLVGVRRARGDMIDVDQIREVLDHLDALVGGEGVGVVLLPLRPFGRSEEHTSELQSRFEIVCRLLLEKKNNRPTKRKTQLFLA